jgi:DNA polymerase III epsilon subunit-like protein
MKSYNIISLDLETTGLSTTKAEIIQLGVAIARWKLDSDKKTMIQEELLPSFCHYVQPDQFEEIDHRVVELTGITQSKLRENNAQKFKEVFPILKQHLDKVCGDLPRVLVSYNGNRFDIPIFCNAMVRYFTEPVAELRNLKLSNNFDLLPCVRGEMDTTCLLRKKG